ncbi:nucleotide sugar dehydrogenase [Methanobacterium alkalithermotolerans]|uniref:UDP-N-acetyl-D-mannosamine dehydrogenase n=1 Tax=Methanobacterium alkalithermotolerans TaxID=2731220 RepID=A0A8T8K3R7_9EURY|nr:nucleotide sugar dehydrogenase [Methanobacterium alkalithermotolerans]QUH22627.1 nucleotide sugar dehydrogenase [Methanobacterium alkalithermotolerans]
MSFNNPKIAIYGLGYIGLPTAALFATSGLKVTGVARNKKRLELINQGKSPIEEPGLDELVAKAVSMENLKATDKGEASAEEADVMIVIVPTPMDKFKRADLDAVKSTCKTISKGLKKGNLVIIESTVPQGTCQNIVIPILEESGLKAGDDFGVAYTPERAIPNNTLYEMTHNARVIGGIDDESADMAITLYQRITEGEIIKVSNLITAETVKLIENTFRDVNIALANEIAMICEGIGVDAIEAINTANHHPRVNIHTPGPGVGGHCLAIDPYFIVETAEEHGMEAPIIRTCRNTNEGMPNHVTKLIIDALTEAGKNLRDSTIGILGVAYKGNVDDARETPAEPLIRILKEKGADVYAHDPLVSDNQIEDLGAIPSDYEVALGCDCVVLVTEHDFYKDIRPEMIKNKVFVCTRSILNLDDYKNNTLIFKGVGKPNN